MRGATSGPTSRALDVLELLAQEPSGQLRYIDIVRTLGLNQGTAHSILKTLSDRGWVSRDPVDKTFALGPALSLVAAKADQSRPRVHAARTVARDLAEELGFSTSVVELSGNELLISAHYAGEDPRPAPLPGLKVPYAPPYGAAFAAFASAEERNAWLGRSTTQSRAVGEALQRALKLCRERGYDVDWMTPAVAQLTTLAGSLDRMPPSLLKAMDQMLLEFTAPAFDEAERAVTSITAPAVDARGRVLLCIAIHPMRRLSARRVQACGRRLAEEARRIATLG